MARTLEQERAAIAADELKLEGRRQRLEERGREQAVAAIEKAGLLKLDGPRLTRLLERIRSLGIDEVDKRLAA